MNRVIHSLKFLQAAWVIGGVRIGEFLKDFGEQVSQFEKKLLSTSWVLAWGYILSHIFFNNAKISYMNVCEFLYLIVYSIGHAGCNTVRDFCKAGSPRNLWRLE
jgi:hypothetical protein